MVYVDTPKLSNKRFLHLPVTLVLTPCSSIFSSVPGNVIESDVQRTPKSDEILPVLVEKINHFLREADRLAGHLHGIVEDLLQSFLFVHLLMRSLQEFLKVGYRLGKVVAVSHEVTGNIDREVSEFVFHDCLLVGIGLEPDGSLGRLLQACPVLLAVCVDIHIFSSPRFIVLRFTLITELLLGGIHHLFGELELLLKVLDGLTKIILEIGVC